MAESSGINSCGVKAPWLHSLTCSCSSCSCLVTHLSQLCCCPAPLPISQLTPHPFCSSGISFPRHMCHLLLDSAVQEITQTSYKYHTDICKWSLNLWLFAVVNASLLLLQEHHSWTSLHTWCLYSLLKREQRTLFLIQQLPSLSSWKLVLVISTPPSMGAPGSSTQINQSQPKESPWLHKMGMETVHWSWVTTYISQVLTASLSFCWSKNWFCWWSKGLLILFLTKTLPPSIFIRIVTFTNHIVYAHSIPMDATWKNKKLPLSWIRNIYNICNHTCLFSLLVSKVVPLVRSPLFLSCHL